MQPLKRFRPLLGALVLGVAFVGASSPARAAFEFDISVTDKAGTPVTIQTSYVVGSAGNYQLTFLGSNSYFTTIDIEAAMSNSPGDPGGAKLTLTNSRITATANPMDSLNHVLDVILTATDYSVPFSPPPLKLTSTASASTSGGGPGTVTFQSWGDPSNTAFGTGAGTFTPGLQSAALPSTPTSGISLQPNPGVAIGNATTYSITVESTFTLSPGVTSTLTGEAWVHHNPAPAGVVLALTGLPLLGIGWLLRRRRRA